MCGADCRRRGAMEVGILMTLKLICLIFGHAFVGTYGFLTHPYCRRCGVTPAQSSKTNPVEPVKPKQTIAEEKADA